MKIEKQAEILNPLFVVKLESGVILLVYDGYAVGSDGKTYYHVGKETDDDLLTVGWSCDVEHTVVIE
ncbi:MAG: hypothetical protein ACI4GY_04640 [Acutalibacteraceae bacterium]